MSLPVRFKVEVYDTHTSPSGALIALSSLYSHNISTVLGPTTSFELKSILNYAISHKIIIISRSSTSPILHIKKPYIFRFTEPDSHQGKALALMMNSLNIRAVCILYRDDAWGIGIKQYLVY